MKNKSLHLIIPIIFIVIFFLLFFLHYNIQLYGDDFWYSYYHTLGLKGCIIESARIFLTTNGRLFPNIFNSLIFFFNINIWRVINVLMICLLIFIIYRFVNFKNKKQKPLILIFIFTLFISMDVLISQESIYWITGSFNYLYPITLALANCYWITKNYNRIITSKKMLTLSIVSTFFTSFLVEQSAILNGIYFFSFSLFQYIFSKKFFNRKLLILFFTAIFGFACIYFSPGCQSRISNEQSITGIVLIISNFKLIINLLFFYRPYQFINILITILLIFYFYKNIRGKRLNKYFFSINIYSLIMFVYIYLKSYISGGYFDINNLTIFLKIIIFISILIFIISIFYYGIIRDDSNDNIYFINIIMVAFLSQIPMLLIPIMGFRTTLVTYICYIIICTKILYDIMNTFKSSDIDSLNIIFINILILLSIFTCYKYYYLIKNYKTNSDIIINNEIILKEKSKNHYLDSEKIYLKKVPLSNYRWMMPYDSPPHMVWYRLYYEVPDNVELYFD